MGTNRASWVMYFVGSALVFASWVNLVPTGLGWTGWLMALIGWAIGARTDRGDHEHPPMSNAEQLEKLDQLRRRNVLTEEEFQQQKRSVLSQSR